MLVVGLCEGVGRAGDQRVQRGRKGGLARAREWCSLLGCCASRPQLGRPCVASGRLALPCFTSVI